MIPKMAWQVIQLRDIKPAPWRNGGGKTRELLAWPSAQAWTWRASVAEVAESGPFSSFVGTQRWFAVLDGDDVCLTVNGYIHMLSKSDPPLAFDGDLTTSCELLGGATQDFNLMVRGGAAARMQRVTDKVEVTVNAPVVIAAYAHRKRALVQIGSEIHELSPHSFGWAMADENTAVRMQTRDALLMEVTV